MSDFTIGRATIDDLDSLLPLVQAYRAFYEQQPDPDRERDFIAAHLRNDTSAIFVARASGKAAGFAQLFKTYSTTYLAPSLILEDLFVDPAYRNRGVASALLNRALEHAKETGAAGMFLETAEDNTAAQRVYERAGWMREARFRKYNAPL